MVRASSLGATLTRLAGAMTTGTMGIAAVLRPARWADTELAKEAQPVESVEPARRDAVVEAVRADLHRRSQLGIAKYGTTLAENHADHRAKLQHFYEELLDGANYCKWAIIELDGNA